MILLLLAIKRAASKDSRAENKSHQQFMASESVLEKRRVFKDFPQIRVLLLFSFIQHCKFRHNLFVLRPDINFAFERLRHNRRGIRSVGGWWGRFQGLLGAAAIATLMPSLLVLAKKYAWIRTIYGKHFLKLFIRELCIFPCILRRSCFLKRLYYYNKPKQTKRG